MVIYNHSWQSEAVLLEIWGNLLGNFGQIHSIQVFIGYHECIRVEIQLVTCLIFLVSSRHILYITLKQAVNCLNT